MRLGRIRKTWGTFLHTRLVSVIRLRARADRRVRDRHRPLGLLFLGQADALSGIASGARDVVNLRQSTGRGLANLRRIGHQIGCANTGEGVLGFTAGARRDRRRRVHRSGDDGHRRGDRNGDRKSAGKDQSSCWKLHGRHRHAFCSCGSVAGFELSVPAKPSAAGNITPTTWKTTSHREEKWCACAISGRLLSGGCGTASTTLAVAP